MANKRPRMHRHVNVAVPPVSRVVSQLLCRGVGSELSEAISTSIGAGEYPARDIDPSTYGCADTFRGDYQLAMMFSKFDDGKSSDLKSQRALAKFSLAEERCRETNERFRNFIGGPLETGVTVEACLFTARRKIDKLLGPLDLNEIAGGFGFGPGASTRLTRRSADAWHKFSGTPETTYNNVVFAEAIFKSHPLWNHGASLEGDGLPYKVVPANHVTTVPKNAEIDRCIAIEPDLNLFVQKGFGLAIRSRLKKVGVNLNDQTLNQRLAYEGSIDSSLATIDLSMASDTVSTSIVRELLPPDWLHALEQCRSQHGRLPSGDTIMYQKFSSMGNGFTFELESLIFWALCSAVMQLRDETDRRFAVYGDDIVVPTKSAESVVGLLSFCGFTTNSKKSFTSGPFRESCGKHYFLGTDVTPFFIRREQKTLADLFLLHNNIMRWVSGPVYRDIGVNGCFLEAIHYIRSVAPSNWRMPRICNGFGDGAFIGSFDEVLPRRHPVYCGWRAEILSEVTVTVTRNGLPKLLKSLYLMDKKKRPRYLSSVAMARDMSLNEPLSKSIQEPKLRRFTVAKTVIRQWDDLGPWA